MLEDPGAEAPAGTASDVAPGPLGQLDFESIYSAHFDMVWRALCRYGVPDSQLEDALQEVFMTAHDRLGSFEGRSSLRTWIYGIARRVARDYRTEARIELRAPERLDQLGEGREGGDAQLEQREAARLLQVLLAQLPIERREILMLVELEQMTVSEAAEVLSENPNTLQSRLRLAREDLTRAWNRLSAEQDWRRQCATKIRR
jgi:RNA polymerase sigma-70 factor (ECF subfamily)